MTSRTDDEATAHAGAPEPSQLRRPAVLLLGVGGAVLLGLLALAQVPGPGVLAAAVFVGQVLLVLGLLALLEAPGAWSAFALGAGAAVAADLVVLLTDGDVGALAGVVGLAVVAALFLQLARRTGRVRVTEALADSLLSVVLVTSAACLVALRRLPGGHEVLLVALAGAAAALLVGRCTDRLVARPRLAAGAARGWPGLLLGLAVGTAAGFGVATAAGRDGQVTGLAGALLGLAAAACVAAADLAVDLGAIELPGDERRVSALTPVGLLLPVAVLAPVALVAGRLVLA